MYLLNVSSNHRAKFFIGTALTQLSELGDMYVSDVFTSPDRAGGSTVFYNCCVQLDSDLALKALISKTKAIEEQLGRKPSDLVTSQNQWAKKSSQVTDNHMPIDIDVLAQLDSDKDWCFLAKRLPLTDDVCWGLADLQIDIPEKFKKTPKKKRQQIPAAQGWWNE